MIDKIIGYDGKYAIYSSDLNPYGNYIVYETENGEIIYMKKDSKKLSFILKTIPF